MKDLTVDANCHNPFTQLAQARYCGSGGVFALVAWNGQGGQRIESPSNG